jgi:hypothetical protein
LGARAVRNNLLHIESHAALLEQPIDTVTAGPRLGAVVFSAMRHKSLRSAVAQATDIGRAQVVLCGKSDQFRHSLKECGSPASEILVPYAPGHLGAYRYSIVEQRFRLITNIASRLLRKTEYIPITGYARTSLIAVFERLAMTIELCCWQPIVRAWRMDTHACLEKLTKVPMLADQAHAPGYLDRPIPIGAWHNDQSR